MRQCIRVLGVLLLGMTAAPAAWAASDGFAPELTACTVDVVRATPWVVSFGAIPAAPAPVLLTLRFADDQGAAPRRVVAFEYSEGYKTRAKLHKIASFATLPVFVANYFVGQDLYNNGGGSESESGVHGFLGATTGVLFGMNSVTGVWNLLEARKDPSHKTKRTIHGILMLAADAGFVATGMMTPDDDGTYDSYSSQRKTHRTVALTSMAIATVAYVIMLFGD